MTPTKYPRIWDRSGEREIVGETRVSWLVKSRYSWMLPEKVAKKCWNKNEHFPQWFDSEEPRAQCIWAEANRYNIIRQISYATLSPATLRTIAELIGYGEKE